jgi:hypothetical protein
VVGFVSDVTVGKLQALLIAALEAGNFSGWSSRRVRRVGRRSVEGESENCCDSLCPSHMHAFDDQLE